MPVFPINLSRRGKAISARLRELLPDEGFVWAVTLDRKSGTVTNHRGVLARLVHDDAAPPIYSELSPLVSSRGQDETKTGRSKGGRPPLSEGPSTMTSMRIPDVWTESAEELLAAMRRLRTSPPRALTRAAVLRMALGYGLSALATATHALLAMHEDVRGEDLQRALSALVDGRVSGVPGLRGTDREKQTSDPGLLGRREKERRGATGWELTRMGIE